MESVRIAGMRRKKKRVSKIKFQIKKNKDELKLIHIINNINSEILKLNEENYDIFKHYIEEDINNLLIETNKSDFTKKTYYLEFKKDPFCFFDQVFTMEESDRLKFNNDLVIIYRYMIKDFLGVLVIFFSDLQEILINSKYLEETLNNNDNDMTLSECYKFFEIKLSEELSKDDIKKIYRKKALKLHPDKHMDEKEKYEKEFKKLNEYYKFILNKM